MLLKKFALTLFQIFVFFTLVLFFDSFSAYAQNQTKNQSSSLNDKLRIFIDCPDYFCDLDYYRTEIIYVDYVRDRNDAQVHILITTQGTGGGGMEFTVNFIGLKQFKGSNNTLKYISKQNDTEDDIRRGLVRFLKSGLMQYVAHSPAINNINISYTETKKEKDELEKVNDPWNLWTFRTSLRTSGGGEKSYKSNRINSSFSASRTTEEWKMRFSISGSYKENKYDYGDDINFTDIRRNFDVGGLIVKSITDHWSIGSRASAEVSTYRNYDLSVNFAPGFEYNIFPYSESTRRQLTLQYVIGASYNDYNVKTVFLKTLETVFDHSISVSYDIKEPWGSISTSIDVTDHGVLCSTLLSNR